MSFGKVKVAFEVGKIYYAIVTLDLVKDLTRTLIF